MGHPTSTRTYARTAVVAVYVVALALAGRPGWLAALLGVPLVAVWAAPLLLVTNRRRRPAEARRPVVAEPAVEPQEAGPAA